MQRRKQTAGSAEPSPTTRASSGTRECNAAGFTFFCPLAARYALVRPHVRRKREDVSKCNNSSNDRRATCSTRPRRKREASSAAALFPLPRGEPHAGTEAQLIICICRFACTPLKSHAQRRTQTRGKEQANKTSKKQTNKTSTHAKLCNTQTATQARGQQHSGFVSAAAQRAPCRRRNPG